MVREVGDEGEEEKGGGRWDGEREGKGWRRPKPLKKHFFAIHTQNRLRRVKKREKINSWKWKYFDNFHSILVFGAMILFWQ